MTSFVALYRGATVGEAKLIAVSADHHLVSQVATRMLAAQTEESDDPVLEQLYSGRERVLGLIAGETGEESSCVVQPKRA